NAPGAISCFVILIHLHQPLDPDATAFGAERFHSTRSLQRDGRALTVRQRAEVPRSRAVSRADMLGRRREVGPRSALPIKVPRRRRLPSILISFELSRAERPPPS